MADKVDLTKQMPRGAYPSPRHVLAGAKPFDPDLAAPAPSGFLMWPVQMSMWGNDHNGDCVTAEEAFAKATAAPQKYFPDDEVINWAQSHGYLNGAILVDVMSTMRTHGFPSNFTLYNDPFPLSVNWTNDAALQSAIFNNGPVKIGVAAELFEDGATGKVTPGTSGWSMCGYPAKLSEYHCVSLCGYGTLAELILLFQQRGVPLNIVEGMPSGLCYAMFTWNSIGIVDRQSLMNMTSEAWVRTPVTMTAPQPPPAYLTTHGSNGLYTFDPAYQAWPVQIPCTDGFGFGGVVKLGNTLFLAAQNGLFEGGGLWTFDLQSRATPVMIASSTGLGFRDLAVIGTTLYLTTQGSNGIYCFDTQSPELPPTQIAGTDGLGFRSVIAIGNTLYLTTQGDDGIWSFDVTRKSPPSQLANTGDLGFNGLLAGGDILYLTAQGGSDGIWQFNLSTGAAPTQFANTAGFGFLGLAMKDQMLYLTTQGNDGIYCFNMATQAAPSQVPSTPTYGFWDIVFT
ncbi:hypothetical protein ACN469_23545 [Corallococcus terminator]